MPTDKTIYYGGSTSTYTVTESWATFQHDIEACTTYEYSVTDNAGTLPAWLIYTKTGSLFEF